MEYIITVSTTYLNDHPDKSVWAFKTDDVQYVENLGKAHGANYYELIITLLNTGTVLLVFVTALIKYLTSRNKEAKNNTSVNIQNSLKNPQVTKLFVSIKNEINITIDGKALKKENNNDVTPR